MNLRAPLPHERIRLQAGLLDAVGEAVVATGLDGIVAYWNRAAERLFGWSAAEAVGARVCDLVVPPEAEAVTTRIIERIAGGESWSGEAVALRRDAPPCAVRITAAPIRDESGSVVGTVAVAADITTERAVADRLRLQATLLDAVGEAVAATDLDGRITYWNRQAHRQSGWAAEEVIGRRLREVIATPASLPTVAALLGHATSGRSWSGELEIARRDGSSFPGLVSVAPVRDDAGSVVGLVGTTGDLTEVKELEAQLRQSQRMEAVGRLAGGVAHDFNNLLTGIRGYAELAIATLTPSDPLRDDIDEIRKASVRAAGLTRQLLAFSRKQVLQPRVLDLRALVEGMWSMLARLIGEDVELTLRCDGGPLAIRADPGQIEQVVLNLVVNARDAMPSGGRLGVELARSPDGDEVLLRIRDTGEGIADDVLPHIFEPFFTTKGVGVGTGLGLSTVYGIVVQSGGRIDVQSTQGSGAAFEVRLPGVDAEPEAAVPAAEGPARARGETILFVEDDEAVISLGVRILERLGYEVLAARSGDEALLAFERHDGPIDLLLTDVVMPNMSGRELAERLRGLRPGLNVLYVSGYTHDIIGRHGVLEPGVAILEKPFTPTSLGARVREALDGAAVRAR